MDNEVKDEIRKKNSEFRTTDKTAISMSAKEDEDGSPLEIEYCDEKIFENDVIFELVIQNKIRTLTSMEKTVLEKYMNGYTIKEMANELGCHTQGLYIIRKHLQDKLHDEFKNQLKQY